MLIFVLAFLYPSYALFRLCSDSEYLPFYFGPFVVFALIAASALMWALRLNGNTALYAPYSGVPLFVVEAVLLVVAVVLLVRMGDPAVSSMHAE